MVIFLILLSPGLGPALAAFEAHAYTLPAGYPLPATDTKSGDGHAAVQDNVQNKGPPVAPGFLKISRRKR
jgi:hypothetical protein